MITSLNNARIKHIGLLITKSKVRNKERCFVAEGFKMFEEAPVNLIKEVYVEEKAFKKMEESFKEAPSSLLGECFRKYMALDDNTVIKELVTDEVIKKASDTETPQGILFIAKMPEYRFEDILDGNLLILEDIQDPGNLGTMIRTAEGAGVSGVIMSKGTVDIFNPKTIRSTMGSLFRVPFVYADNLIEAVSKVKKAGTKVYAAHLRGKQNYDEIDYNGKSAVLIGNEGNGLKDETADSADIYVRIPMSGKLESLNASIAAALMMYRMRG